MMARLASQFLNGGMLKIELRPLSPATSCVPSSISCRLGPHQQAAVRGQCVLSRLKSTSIPRFVASSRMMSEEISSPKQQDASSPVKDGPKATKTVNARIKGTVQGVFYRKWTVDTSRKLGLQGWVRNCRDGSVEAVFSGPPELVDSMLNNCRVGPPAAKVTAVDVSTWSDPVPDVFELRPTTR